MRFEATAPASGTFREVIYRDSLRVKCQCSERFSLSLFATVQWHFSPKFCVFRVTASRTWKKKNPECLTLRTGRLRAHATEMAGQEPPSNEQGEFKRGGTDDHRRSKRKVTKRCDRKGCQWNQGVTGRSYRITQGNAVESCVIKTGRFEPRIRWLPLCAQPWQRAHRSSGYIGGLN
jgi:hypothetical protein